MPASRARATTAGMLGLALALACVVHQAARGSGRAVSLDEETALRLAEGLGVDAAVRERIAAGGTREESVIAHGSLPQLLANEARHDMARERAGKLEKLDERRSLAKRKVEQQEIGRGPRVAGDEDLGWLARVKPLSPRAADAQTSAMAMAKAFFRNSPGDFGHASFAATSVPKPGAVPVWPGYADFERHEEALRGAAPKQSPRQVEALGRAAPKQSLNVPRTDTPQCPCRGGCPCPAHGHGGNVVDDATSNLKATELKEGVKEGLKMGLKIGIKLGRDEEREILMHEHEESEQDVQAAPSTEHAASQQVAHHIRPVSESAEMKKVLSDLSETTTSAGKTSQPTSLPWPFPPALPTPYPAPKGGEFRGHEKKAVQTRPVVGMLKSDKQRMLDSRSAQSASHASHVGAVTNPTWNWDKKKEAMKKLLMKAFADEHKVHAEGDYAADASSQANSAAVLRETRDFDRRASALQKQILSTPAAVHVNPALAKAITAVHDVRTHVQRTAAEKADDARWQAQVAKADREMQQATHAIALSTQEAAAVSSLRANAARKANARQPPVKADAGPVPGLVNFESQFKELKKEVDKDEQVVQDTHGLIRAHKLAAPRDTQQLADFKAPLLGEDGAKALGFDSLDGLKGREKHFARTRSRRQSASGVALHDSSHSSDASSGKAAARAAVSVASDKGVEVDVRALGDGREGDAVGMKGRVDAEDATMRAAIATAALKKAEAIGPLAAVALGYSGVDQLAAHLRREALDLE